MFKSISVSTETRDNYLYHVGTGLLEKACDFIKENFGTNNLIVVIDKNVHQFHFQSIQEVLNPVFQTIDTYVVPPGEQSKNIEQYSSILDFVLTSGVERKTPLLAIGGGVTGDLSGFVAASVLRGIPLIHMPTSLLAMVDSSIGGKTGINHKTGKNLIGDFYQPKAVFADIQFLETLPPEEWVNGLSEIIKYGMIEDSGLLNDLTKLTESKSFTPSEEWIEIIRRSAEIKIEIVQRDVLEGGVRAFLNFGHTYGHVIEKMGNYSRFSHGEAVFAGMYGAISASTELGHNIEVERLNAFRELYKIDLADFNSVDELIKWMYKDKKVANQSIRLVLLKSIGEPFVYQVEDLEILKKSWAYLLTEFS